MKRIIATFLIASLAFVALACNSDDDGDPTMTPTPGDSETPSPSPTSPPEEESPTPTPTVEPQDEGEAPEGLYGHGKRTGVPEIDAILEAWEKGDIDALVALALLQKLECVTTPEGIGGPPTCPDGVPGGTVVDVMAAASCEGYYVYETQLETLFKAFIDGMEGKSYYLYAAWESDGDEHRPAGYRIQFARSVTDFDIFSPQITLDEDGKIFLFASGCNPAPVQVPADADFVVEPKDGATGLTGIPGVDNFLTIRGQQNVSGVANLVTFFKVACKLPSEATYYVHCPDGQPSGTMVDAWPWWGCHGAFSNAGTRDQIAEFFTTREGIVNAVVRFENAGSVDMFPAEASLAVIMESADGLAWAAVLDDDGNFYGMVSGCPATADELVELHFDGAKVLFEAA